MSDRITIKKPFGGHLHLRWTRKMLRETILLVLGVYGRGIVIGNLSKPRGLVKTREDAVRYRNEIREAVWEAHTGDRFEPIIPLMLTKRTTPETLEKAVEWGFNFLKYIPGKTSTGSEDDGISLDELLEEMPLRCLKKAAELKMYFLIHLERITKGGKLIPEIDREVAAIPDLIKIIEAVPNLQISVEHVSTAELLKFLETAPKNVTFSLTVHHALETYDKAFHPDGTIKNPFLYCMPVLKRVKDVEAVRRAMFGLNLKLKGRGYSGTDIAPHPEASKRTIPPAAGICISGDVAMPMRWMLFKENGISKEEFERFESVYAPTRYGLSPEEGSCIIKREKWMVPKTVGQGTEEIPVYMGGQELDWRVEETRS